MGNQFTKCNSEVQDQAPSHFNLVTVSAPTLPDIDSIESAGPFDDGLSTAFKYSEDSEVGDHTGENTSVEFWGIYQVKPFHQLSFFEKPGFSKEKDIYILLDFTRSFQETYSKAQELSQKFFKEIIISSLDEKELQSQPKYVYKKIIFAKFSTGKLTFTNDNLLGPALC